MHSVNSKGEKQHRDSQRLRILLLFLCIEFCFILLIIRLFYIQYAPNYQQIANKQVQIILKSKVKRGKIYSRNMGELAVNRDMISVWADPSVINVPTGKVAELLAPSLDSTPEELLYLLNQKNKRFVWLKRKLDYGLFKQIRQKLDTNKIYGVGILIEEKRFYPKGKLASHVIGYANFDNKGVYGVEKVYDSEMKSYDYEERYPLAKDGKSRIIKPVGLNDDMPTYNNSIVLTIDEFIQDIAEMELASACEKWSALSGSVIVMNPKTGEVIAMANYPTYDLNLFSEVGEECKRNLAIWAPYEPGSIFKIVTMSAALNEGVVSLSDTIYCEWGEYQIYGKTIHDDAAYGSLTLSEVIEKSSNIGATKIAERMEKSTFDRYIRAFGFGQRTSIDLPYEGKGNINALEKWGKYAMIYVPWGQGISVTPLQMLSAVNVIANGGILMKPYVVNEIRDDKGNVIKTTVPEVQRRVISTETANKVTGMLVRAVKFGTGKRAQIEGYQVAGKTGTSQKAGEDGYSDKHISSFVGFLPADNPKLSIIVVINEPQGKYHGSQVAAPVFGAIGKRAMRYIEANELALSEPK